MKRKLPIHKSTTYVIGETFPDSLRYILPKMQEIYQNLFERSSAFDFNKLLKHRGDLVTLRLFFGKNSELAGFAVAGIQVVNVNDETHAIFSAGVYSNLKYNLSQQVSKFALVLSLKYKMRHPTHRLGYLAEAVTPAPYSLAASILPECYPHPSLKTPDYVSSIIKAMSRVRNFIIENNSEFIVSFVPRIITRKPENLISSSKSANCKYYQHYISLNPDFQSGNALLIYMPLTLKNILIGFKNKIKRGFKQ